MHLLCLSMRLRKSLIEAKVFAWHRKSRKFSTFSSFRRMTPEASIEYLGSFRSVPDVFWSWSFEFSSSKKSSKKSIFWCPHDRFRKVLGSFEWNLARLNAVSHSRVCGLATRFRRDLGTEDLFEYTRSGEGSTGPSRGEQRLTVYRAHPSRLQKCRFLKTCEFNWNRNNFSR